MIKKLLIALLLLIAGAVVIFFAPAVLRPTLTHETRVMINKTTDEVWDKWTDSKNMGKWIHGFKSIETISGDPMTVGSKYKIVIENEGEVFEATETIKEVVIGEKFAFELDGDIITDDVVVTLVNKGLTTELIQSETITAKGFFWKALFYWMQSSMSEQSQKNLNNLKKFIEES